MPRAATPVPPDLETLVREAATPDALHALYLAFPAKDDSIAQAMARAARVFDAALYREIARHPYRVRLYLANPAQSPAGHRAIAQWALARLQSEVSADAVGNAQEILATLIRLGHLPWDAPVLDGLRALVAAQKPRAPMTRRRAAAAHLLAEHRDTPAALIEAIQALAGVTREPYLQRVLALHRHASSASRVAWLGTCGATDLPVAAACEALRDDPAARAALVAQAVALQVPATLTPLCAEGRADCRALLQMIVAGGGRDALRLLARSLVRMAPRLTVEDLAPFCEHPDAETRLLAVQAAGLVPPNGRAPVSMSPVR